MKKRNLKTFNRYFTTILYKDDKRFDDLLLNIKKLYTEITYITHDRDINEDGNLKKSHVHIIFKVGENARSVNSIADELQYNVNMIEGCNHDNMLLYLLHKNNPEKSQYNFEEVEGDTSRLATLLEKSKDINDRFLSFLNDIEDLNINDVSGLLKLACNTNKLDILCRSQYLFYNLVKNKYNIIFEKKLDLVLTELKEKYNINLSIDK